jgi:phage replication O-like protein O
MAQTAQIIQLHDQLRERRPRVKADTDDGWFKISTALAKAECCLKMSPYEWMMYAVVKTKTYGFRKSFDWISASQFEEETSVLPDGTREEGIPEKKVSEVKKRLVARNILVLNGKKIGVNTVVSEWIYRPFPTTKKVKKLPLEQSKTTLSKVKTTLSTGINYPLNGGHNKKDNNNKIITKDIVRKPDDNPVCSDVISYLNEKANKRFKNTPAIHKNINARIKEGHSIDDLKAVIDHKSIQWGQDRQMIAYLRPSTLFSAKNFESYLSIVNLPPVANSSGNQRQTQQFSETDYSLGTEGFEHV